MALLYSMGIVTVSRHAPDQEPDAGALRFIGFHMRLSHMSNQRPAPTPPSAPPI